LSSCAQRVICPAYQSAFIFDKPTAKEKFVYYNESTTASRDVLASNGKTITLPARDSAWSKSTVMPGPSLPKVQRVKMDKYLLLPEKTYKKAMRSLQTVEMKQVLPKKKVDSLDIKAALDSAARSITDTLTVQAAKPKAKAEVSSEFAITKTKEKYNLDQDIYMWYLRDILVLPDVRAAMQEDLANSNQNKKAKQGFFKRLFGKKDKTKKVDGDVPVGNESNDSTAVNQKKSINPFKKKSTKATAVDPKKKADPAKKEEDDGF
jgi:hypothetical protein